MLEEVDKPGSEINVYVENLDKVLNHQLSQIENLTSRLKRFKGQLQEEQRLSKICQERQQLLMDPTGTPVDVNYDEISEVPRNNIPPIESSKMISPMHMHPQENYKRDY